MRSNSKPEQPSLQEIAEAQGLTYVEGLGVYSETGDLMLQLHPDPDGLHDGCAYAIPEVVEWGYTTSKEDDNRFLTWATVFTNAPGSSPYVHYFLGLDPKEDTYNQDVICRDNVPDLRTLVADWRAQARRVKR